jgi:NOL1/NOP2/sun family putative RNA methylase
MRARRTNLDESTPSGLERYRPIVPEWDRFVDVCSRALPDVIRTNTLRIDPKTLCARLNANGIDATPVEWESTLLRVSRPVGNTLEHWLGLAYVQEAIQVLPVLALDPHPGETNLDLCAAPGGKATHIAARMENRGCLIANEPSGRRQQALLANLNRIGVLNATTTSYRGESFPLRTRFDRILVDAPCSAEGTLRKVPSLRSGASLSTIRRLARLQERLLVRAYDLLRPGGVLVYSTCTFAPEENEAVVAHLLCTRDARLTAIPVPFPAAPGVAEWQGRRFPNEVHMCVRIYPHHSNSGGGFIARIERSA